MSRTLKRLATAAAATSALALIPLAATAAPAGYGPASHEAGSARRQLGRLCPTC